MYTRLKYKVPILDVGNVLVSVDMDAFYHMLTRLRIFGNNKFAEKFMRHIEQNQNLGMTNLRNAIDYIYHQNRDWQLGVEDPEHLYSEIIDYWCSNNVWQPNLEIIDWVYDSLARHHFSAVIIASNMGVDHYNAISKCHPLFKHPDVIDCFSFQIGAIKPQYLFWRSVFEKRKDYLYAGKDSDYDSLYVDDRENFILGAKSCNPTLKTFQFDSTKQKQSVLIERLETFITEI